MLKMNSTTIKSYSDEDQKRRSNHLISTFNCIPVLISPANDKTPKIKKELYLCPKDTQYLVLLTIIRKNIPDLKPCEGIFVYVGDKIPCGTAMVIDIFKDHHINGWLYLKYDIESVFG